MTSFPSASSLASASTNFYVDPPKSAVQLPRDCVGLIALDEAILMLGVLKFPFKYVDDDVIPGFVRPALHLWARCQYCSEKNAVMRQMVGERNQIIVVFCSRCDQRYTTRPALPGEYGANRHVVYPFKTLDAVPHSEVRRGPR